MGTKLVPIPYLFNTFALAMSGKELHPLRQVVWGILAILVLFNTAGFWVIYKGLDAYLYYQHLENKKAKATADENLITLSLPRDVVKQEKGNFTWVEEEEFRYKDRMYDVHRRTQTPDSVRFRVERDRAEERLAAILLHKKQKNDHAQASLGWVHLVIVEGLVENPLKLDKHIPGFRVESLYRRYSSSIYAKPLTPPPAF